MAFDSRFSLSLQYAAWTVIGAMLLGSSIGCTSFSTMRTSNWFEIGSGDGGADRPVNHLLTYWDNHVRIVQDTQNQGAPLPGLAGRLFLFNDETHDCVDARGAVLVQMYDMTSAAPGKAPTRLAEWRFDAESLKRLKRKDRIGAGYTLFLPWDQYRPDIKEVQLQVCYAPEKGAPRYTEPQSLTLQSADQSVPNIEQRQVVPARQERPLAATAPQSSEQSIPLPVQPPAPASARN